MLLISSSIGVLEFIHSIKDFRSVAVIISILNH